MALAFTSVGKSLPCTINLNAMRAIAISSEPVVVSFDLGKHKLLQTRLDQ